MENRPTRHTHQYLRGETAKLLTLLCPAAGELRAEAVPQNTNAILHPWLQRELTAILKQCSPAPETVPIGQRWQDWDIYPVADQLDRFFPPVRILLIWDNLAGHQSQSMVQWCAEHGILLLSMPNAGSWLNMTESVQRIIKRRALQGYHTYDVEILKQWLTDAVIRWHRHPAPFIWGGIAWEVPVPQLLLSFHDVCARFATTTGQLKPDKIWHVTTSRLLGASALRSLRFFHDANLSFFFYPLSFLVEPNNFIELIFCS